MSQHSSHPVSWFRSLNQWIQGSSKRKRIEQVETPAPAHVEFLETRQLLSATNPTQSATQNPADPAPDTATAGSTSTTTKTHGVDANGNPTTTTTDADGNTTTSSTSTTTVDGTTTPVSTSIDSDQAIATAIQSDGKIILVGAAQMNTLGDYDFAITRLNA
ncbi:MAG: hypothetical protein JWN70_4792, partial [Planctomycetaceae bacterium]|nr:hypothetical protein [Planctomycetaceae bacterium]